MEWWNDGVEGVLSIKNGLFNFITQYSIIPDGWDFDLSPDNHITSICYRNSETFNWEEHFGSQQVGKKSILTGKDP